MSLEGDVPLELLAELELDVKLLDFTVLFTCRIFRFQGVSSSVSNSSLFAPVSPVITMACLDVGFDLSKKEMEIVEGD